LRIRSIAVMAVITGTLSGVASAQIPAFLKGSATSENKGSPVNLDKTLRQGQDLLAMITLATDLGVDAGQHLAAVYPPEKVELIQKLSAKYNELKAKRGSGDVDAEQLKLASDISAETAKLELESNGSRDQKKTAREVRKAHAKLGVMLIADGLAAIQIPPTVDALKNAISQVTKNPLSGMAKAAQIQKQITVLIAVPGAAASQVQSAKSVRKTCARIAEAEKFSLGADPSADSIKNVAELKAKVTDLDASEPAEETNQAEMASAAIAPPQPSSAAPPKDETQAPTMAARSSAPEPPPSAISTEGATTAETYSSRQDVVSEKKTPLDVDAPEPAEKTRQVEKASAGAGLREPSSGASPKNETHEPTLAARSSAQKWPPAATSAPAATLRPAQATASSVVSTGQTTRVEGPDAEMVERLGIAIRQIARRGSCLQCRQLLQRTETLGALVRSAQDPARTLDDYEVLVKELAQLQHG
jgi:hypothetical protein